MKLLVKKPDRWSGVVTSYVNKTSDVEHSNSSLTDLGSLLCWDCAQIGLRLSSDCAQIVLRSCFQICQILSSDFSQIFQNLRTKSLFVCLYKSGSSDYCVCLFVKPVELRFCQMSVCLFSQLRLLCLFVCVGSEQTHELRLRLLFRQTNRHPNLSTWT